MGIEIRGTTFEGLELEESGRYERAEEREEEERLAREEEYEDEENARWDEEREYREAMGEAGDEYEEIHDEVCGCDRDWDKCRKFAREYL
jgi:hypothetical protein